MNKHSLAGLIFFFGFILALYGKEGWGWCFFIAVIMS